MNMIGRDFAYGRNAVYTQSHHGNAILSPFPIVHFANHDLSAAHREPFAGPAGRPARSCPARRPLLRHDRIYRRRARARSAQPPAQRPWSQRSDRAALKAPVCL